ncbi:MAG: hypothetical protein IJ873_01750 [Lachnospiraceae bacterium]|nr:hypothetical protein [Lachnospiraceae bacterium]
MSLVAPVVDGAIAETATISSASEKKTTGNSSLDKESFLKLLVAQMQYQDPLEPTENTEYISQFAQFSELEQMQNLSSSMDLQRASGLVGQYVYLEHINETTGASTSVEGRVDYVTYENNKAYVSVDGELYSMDDVVNVIDAEYAETTNLIENFSKLLGDLPGVDYLTIADKDSVAALQTAFNNMSVYQQGFVSEDQVNSLTEYVARMAQLVAAAEKAAEESGETKTEGETSADTTNAVEAASTAETENSDTLTDEEIAQTASESGLTAAEEA